MSKDTPASTTDDGLESILDQLDEQYSLWAKCGTQYMQSDVAEAKQAILALITERERLARIFAQTKDYVDWDFIANMLDQLTSLSTQEEQK
jgi:hypothetical protein